LPRRPIKPAGYKTGTVANTRTYDGIDSMVAYIGGSMIDYGFMSSSCPLIIHDAKPEIVDPALTLIFKT